MNYSTQIQGQVTAQAGVSASDALKQTLGTAPDGLGSSVGNVTDIAQTLGQVVGGKAGTDITAVAGGSAQGAQLGSAAGPWGTAIGAVAGAVAGALKVIHIGANPHPGMDDAYWDVLGKKGKKSKEPTGQTISTEQSAMVDKYAKAVTADPNWQLNWPYLWNNMAHSTQAHSSLLANAVARRLKAPQGGGAMVTPIQMADSIVRTFVAALMADGACPSNDSYLIAAHAALSKAQSEGAQVLALVQKKVSLVESFGLAANGLTAQVNACRAASAPKTVSARATQPVRPVSPQPPKVAPPANNLKSKQWWAEVLVASTVAVGLGVVVQRGISGRSKERSPSDWGDDEWNKFTAKGK